MQLKENALEKVRKWSFLSSAYVMPRLLLVRKFPCWNFRQSRLFFWIWKGSFVKGGIKHQIGPFIKGDLVNVDMSMNRPSAASSAKLSISDDVESDDLHTASGAREIPSVDRSAQECRQAVLFFLQVSVVHLRQNKVISIQDPRMWGRQGHSILESSHRAFRQLLRRNLSYSLSSVIFLRNSTMIINTVFKIAFRTCFLGQ